jgi:hypothetical protein
MNWSTTLSTRFVLRRTLGPLEVQINLKEEKQVVWELKPSSAALFYERGGFARACVCECTRVSVCVCACACACLYVRAHVDACVRDVCMCVCVCTTRHIIRLQRTNARVSPCSGEEFSIGIEFKEINTLTVPILRNVRHTSDA